MMCAATAGRRGRRVALLEHNDRPGKKIFISGGGRCNFTNLNAGPENYLSSNPDFCRSALARFTPWDFINLVEKYRIAYHEKKLGQQFCTTSSRQIIDLLLAECASARVSLITQCQIRDIRKHDRFVLDTSHGSFLCQCLVIATGGLSFPKLGATDLAYKTARQFGLRLIDPSPGLVPLTFSPGERSFFESLSGLSLPVSASLGKVAFEESMLFTHRGVSGPAILQISSYRRQDSPPSIDLLPHLPGASWLQADRSSRLSAAQILHRHWPERFTHAWCSRHVPDKPLQHFKNREVEALVHLVHHWPLPVRGTEGYPKAEVTLGGVDTRDLSSKSMEARTERGLYFIGEAVDVTGWLGGYNFQWAWSSGFAAGSAA